MSLSTWAYYDGDRAETALEYGVSIWKTCNLFPLATRSLYYAHDLLKQFDLATYEMTSAEEMRKKPTAAAVQGPATSVSLA